MLNVLIAPDSFKGTLSAEEVCDITERALKDTIKDVKVAKLPVADGGEGLCFCLHSACGGEMIKSEVTGVFGEKMTAEYLMLPDRTAVIEMSACAGLPLAGDRKNPELATTYGVGEMITDAVSEGAVKILLGLGGSATNDCGIGMASALGYIFEDENGNRLNPIGANLGKISKIIPPENKITVPVTAVCDVKNPLCGENGAAFVFAPQKGADRDMVLRLDKGMENFADKANQLTGTDIRNMPGAGAAGGLGAGAVVFLGATLRRGIDIILDVTGFDNMLKNADLVITGEGQLDYQSLNGKVISGVTERCVKNGVKVITLCGCAGKGAEKAKELGVSAMYFSCTEPKSWDEIVRDCRKDLYSAAVKLAKGPDI